MAAASPPASRPVSLGAAAVVIAAATVAVAAVGGLSTDTTSDWYRGLDLPAFQPPGAVFGIAWTILYAMIAVSAWTAFRALATPRRARVMGLYAVNGVLNLGWTLIFFQGHSTLWAGLEILVLEATVLALIATTWRPARVAALLLVPYALWVAFATALTWTIHASS